VRIRSRLREAIELIDGFDPSATTSIPEEKIPA
jgi:hypothetical protein